MSKTPTPPPFPAPFIPSYFPTTTYETDHSIFFNREEDPTPAPCLSHMPLPVPEYTLPHIPLVPVKAEPVDDSSSVSETPLLPVKVEPGKDEGVKQFAEGPLVKVEEGTSGAEGSLRLTARDGDGSLQALTRSPSFQQEALSIPIAATASPLARAGGAYAGHLANTELPLHREATIESVIMLRETTVDPLAKCKTENTESSLHREDTVQSVITLRETTLDPSAKCKTENEDANVGVKREMRVKEEEQEEAIERQRQIDEAVDIFNKDVAEVDVIGIVRKIPFQVDFEPWPESEDDDATQEEEHAAPAMPPNTDSEMLAELDDRDASNAEEVDPTSAVKLEPESSSAAPTTEVQPTSRGDVESAWDEFDEEFNEPTDSISNGTAKPDMMEVDLAPRAEQRDSSPQLMTETNDQQSTQHTPAGDGCAQPDLMKVALAARDEQLRPSPESSRKLKNQQPVYEASRSPPPRVTSREESDQRHVSEQVPSTRPDRRTDRSRSRSPPVFRRAENREREVDERSDVRDERRSRGDSYRPARSRSRSPVRRDRREGDRDRSNGRSSDGSDVHVRDEREGAREDLRMRINGGSTRTRNGSSRTSPESSRRRVEGAWEAFDDDAVDLYGVASGRVISPGVREVVDGKITVRFGGDGEVGKGKGKGKESEVVRDRNVEVVVESGPKVVFRAESPADDMRTGFGRREVVGGKVTFASDLPVIRNPNDLRNRLSRSTTPRQSPTPTPRQSPPTTPTHHPTRTNSHTPRYNPYPRPPRGYKALDHRTRPCSHCGQVKPEAAFSKSQRRNKDSALCKRCVALGEEDPVSWEIREEVLVEGGNTRDGRSPSGGGGGGRDRGFGGGLGKSKGWEESGGIYRCVEPGDE
ncbi:hypothetical protein HDV00_006351 [Rhizophlyctis rosea]|nr:hypothetical protein HDV00_006351 [Rhizophlyctis rosea]